MMFSSATRIAKKPKHFRETEKHLEKQKTQRILRNVWAQGFLHFVFFFDFFSFLVKLQFLGFWIWKRSSSSATRIVRNT